MGKKKERFKRFLKLKRGEATKKILKYMSDETLIFGLNIYRMLECLLSVYPTIPFPTHLIHPIARGLGVLEHRGYLTEEDVRKIEDQIIRQVKKGIKKYEKTPHSKRVYSLPPGTKRASHLYRSCYPETVIKETNFPLDFIIYFIAQRIKKRLRSHTGFRRWDLITDFLSEQGILREKNYPNSIQKRYLCKKNYIARTYFFIHQCWPPLPDRPIRLPEWETLASK